MPARLLHWTMAVLVLATIPAGFVMVQPGLDRETQNALFIFHKNVGVLLLLLVIVRLVYRGLNSPPPLPSSVPPLQQRIAHASHMAIYLLLVVMPVAGYVRVRAGGFPIESLDALGIPAIVPRSDALAAFAKSTHYVGGIALTVLVVLHCSAAFYHGILKRDGVFSRIWPPFGRRPAGPPLAPAKRSDI
jgi:cytochrome b561